MSLESSNLDSDSKYTKVNEQFIKQRRTYNTRSKNEKQRKIVNITCLEGKQKYRDHNESTKETDSNNSYDVRNYNTESDWTPQDDSSENSPTRNKVAINNHIKQNNKKVEHSTINSNQSQGAIQRYATNIENYLSGRKKIINNTKNKLRKNIQGKEVPVRKKNKSTGSHPKQNLYNIFQTKKIGKQKLPPIKAYIRCSNNKNTHDRLSKTSSLSNNKSTNKQKNYNIINLTHNKTKQLLNNSIETNNQEDIDMWDNNQLD